ncbi:MAG: DUF177 domain-containing protein, partial [Bacteroidales bacterium]|nr:DUF177 domain-containing protein [Bacteroidales bacterium]
TKQLDLILLNFVFNGFALVYCDRCGEEFQQPLSGNNELIVKRGDNFIDEDDIITIPFNDKSLNLTQYFYEYLNLLLPMKNIHPLDKNNKSTCNIENLKLLEHYTSDKNNNNDSPWSILNQLKNKL